MFKNIEYFVARLLIIVTIAFLAFGAMLRWFIFEHTAITLLIIILILILTKIFI